MKALVLTAPSTLEILDVPIPQPAADEVLLRIRACGICGSDIHGWDGSSGRRRPPLIMGHEAAGVVAAIGNRVKTFRPGDRVTFDSTVYCGKCDACAAGHINLCRNRRVVGVAPRDYKQDGAFAEFLALPERILHRIPDTLPFERAAFVEPVSIALHAVGRIDASSLRSAVVVGSGMIGLLVIQALRHAKVPAIVAIDLEPSRLALARQFGATHTFQPGANAIAEELASLTGNGGADAAFEVVGATPTVRLALDLVRPGGAVVLVGNLAPTVEFPLQIAVTRELTVLGSCGSAGEYPQAIELIAQGAIQVEPLLSATAPLSDGPAWFARLSGPEGGKHLKVILQP